MNKKYLQVSISHTGADEGFASKVHKELGKCGIEAFLFTASTEANAGRRPIDVIAENFPSLSSSGVYIVAIASKEYLKKGTEILAIEKAAISSRILEGAENRNTMIVRLDGAEVSDMWRSNTVYVDFESGKTGEPERLAECIEKACRKSDDKDLGTGEDWQPPLQPRVANHMLLARIYITQMDFAATIQECGKAIDLQPDYADAYNNRGVAKGMQGDLDEAIKDYSKAIELKPDDATAYYSRALAKIKQGDLDGAVKDYSKVIELKPDDATAYYSRALAKIKQGDLDGAVKDNSKVIELKPDDTAAYYSRGGVKIKQGDLDGAVKDYSKVIELKPDDATAYYSRALAKIKQGDLDGAVKDYSKVIELKPDDTAAYYSRGVVKIKQGDLDGAAKDRKIADDLKNSHENRGI